MEMSKMMKVTEGASARAATQGSTIGFDKVTGLNRFGRKKGDIKVRPGDEPGTIFVDCPANQYGKLPPMVFVTKEESKRQEQENIKAWKDKLAAMTPQELAEKKARFKERCEKREAFDKKYNIGFTSEEIRTWKYRTYGYDPDYYDRMFGTDEEIFEAYEEQYGNK
jgi:hypothetical protein